MILLSEKYPSLKGLAMMASPSLLYFLVLKCGLCGRNLMMTQHAAGCAVKSVTIATPLPPPHALAVHIASNTHTHGRLSCPWLMHALRKTRLEEEKNEEEVPFCQPACRQVFVSCLLSSTCVHLEWVTEWVRNRTREPGGTGSWTELY